MTRKDYLMPTTYEGKSTYGHDKNFPCKHSPCSVLLRQEGYCPEHAVMSAIMSSRRCDFCDDVIPEMLEGPYCSEDCEKDAVSQANDRRCFICSDRIFGDCAFALDDGTEFCSDYCWERGAVATTTIKPVEEAPTIRPNYYRAVVQGVEVECFELIDALDLDFYLGNALKYLWRAGKKEGASKISDLKKIRTYIDQALERAS
jgi:hypothetical protein